MQLGELQKNIEKYREAGAEVWAVSPDEKDKLLTIREGLELSFPTLMDPGAELARVYGILNEKAGAIPHPTAYVVDPDGKILYKRVDVQYTKRPASEELLAALAGSAEKE